MSVDLSGARWFKSSRSTASRDCVEVAHLDGALVGVRDSKNRIGPALLFSPDVWDEFTAAMRLGMFER